MSDRLAVDTDRLDAAGSGVDELSKAVGRARDALAAALAQTEGCWGSDRTGQAFVQNYAPQRDDLKSALDSLRTGLQVTGTNLHTMATGYAEAEARAVESAGKLIVE